MRVTERLLVVVVFLIPSMLLVGRAEPTPHAFEVVGEVSVLGKDVRATIQLPGAEECRRARRVVTASDVREAVARARVGECAPVVEPACWPSGSRRVDHMPVYAVKRIVVAAEGGGSALLNLIEYGVEDGERVTAGWVDGRLVAVDPLSHEPSAPVLWNDREVTAAPENAVRVAPLDVPCRWRTSEEKSTGLRPTQKPRDHEEKAVVSLGVKRV